MIPSKRFERSRRVRDLDRGILDEIPRIRSFLRKLAGEDADDLIQEVLERALRYSSAYSADGSLRGWLLKTAFRVFLDDRQKRARRPETLGERADAIPAETTSAVEDRDEIERLLTGLAPVERRLLFRFHRDGCSIPEIARETGLPAGTVKSHLHRARRKLARPMEDEERHEA